MPATESLVQLPWLQLSEEVFEREFDDYRRYSEAKRSNIDLKGMATHRVMQQAVSKIIRPKKKESLFSGMVGIGWYVLSIMTL